MGVGLSGSSLVGFVVAVVAAIVTIVFARRSRSMRLDPSAISRGLAIVSVVAMAAALWQLGRLSIFMVDSREIGFSSIPNSDWEVRHSCLSAYYVSAKAAGTASNVYGDSLYTAPDDDRSKPRKALMLGLFKIDVFEYPPPFMLLPRALEVVAPDFLRLRALWFGLNGLVILGAFVAIGRMMGPSAGTRALLLSPLIWAALPTASVLQKGNVQALVIAGSMLAMALFARRRWAAGGAILGFATVSKLYPGLLVVYLLARREWRAAMWTAAFALAFAVLTPLVFGWAPYAAFLEHFPRLLSGEAFPAFRNPMATAINYSVPGLVFKLKLFGVPHMTFAASKLVGWVFTLIALAAVAWVARQRLEEHEAPLVWLAVLTVATLRSPFLPQSYAPFPAVWLLTLWTASRPVRGQSLAWALLGWLILDFMWPLDWHMDPRWLAMLTSVPQAVTIALAATVLIATARREPAPIAARVRPIVSPVRG